MSLSLSFHLPSSILALMPVSLGSPGQAAWPWLVLWQLPSLVFGYSSVPALC